MFASTEVKSWPERKRQLLLESEINRRIFVLEWSQLKMSLNWTQSIARKLKSPRPALMLLAPVAGFFLAKRLRVQGGWFSKAFFLWRASRRALSFWKILKGPAAGSK